MSDDVSRLADLMHSLWCLSSQGGVGCDRAKHLASAAGFRALLGDASEPTDAYLTVARGLLASEWLAERDALNRLLGAVQAKSDAIDAHAELVARMEALCDEMDSLADEQVREGDVTESEATRRFSNDLRAALNDPTEETTP